MSGFDEPEEDTLEWWKVRLVRYEEMMEEAMANRSYTAASTLGKRGEVAREMVDKLSAELGAGPEDMTEEELVHEHGKAARYMPDAHLEVYVSEYARRHNVPKLKLVENKG